jgi:hypothetical protein
MMLRNQQQTEKLKEERMGISLVCSSTGNTAPTCRLERLRLKEAPRVSTHRQWSSDDGQPRVRGLARKTSWWRSLALATLPCAESRRRRLRSRKPAASGTELLRLSINSRGSEDAIRRGEPQGSASLLRRLPHPANR